MNRRGPKSCSFHRLQLSAWSNVSYGSIASFSTPAGHFSSASTTGHESGHPTQPRRDVLLSAAVSNSGLSAEQRRALELLAGGPRGAAETLILAHGFTADRLAERATVVTRP